MNTAVCSVYLRRGRDGLIMRNGGLNPGRAPNRAAYWRRTGRRMRKAKTAQSGRCAVASRFAYRPETGEDLFLSCRCAGLRGGDVTGVLVVRTSKSAILPIKKSKRCNGNGAGETLSASGEETLDDTDPDAAAKAAADRRFDGHVVCTSRALINRLTSDDVDEEDARLSAAIYKLRRNVDDLPRRCQPCR